MEIQTKLNKEQFKPLFGSWWSKIEKFFDSGGLDPIYEFLKKESSRGKKLAPLSSNTFRCFLETSYDELKVAMFGLCPYHSVRDGKLVADGLLMGCSMTRKVQPSLEKFYEAISQEMYEGTSYHKNPDVQFLCKQGVLMCNVALTTEVGKACSHQAVWEPFTKYLFEEVLSGTGVPVVLLGKETHKFEKYIAPFTWKFKLSHPASASYKDMDWDTEGAFTQINKILWDTNKFTIDWLDIDKNIPF